jgi:hypothetical protein
MSFKPQYQATIVFTIKFETKRLLGKAILIFDKEKYEDESYTQNGIKELIYNTLRSQFNTESWSDDYYIGILSQTTILDTTGKWSEDFKEDIHAYDIYINNYTGYFIVYNFT